MLCCGVFKVLPFPDDAEAAVACLNLGSGYAELPILFPSDREFSCTASSSEGLCSDLKKKTLVKGLVLYVKKGGFGSSNLSWPNTLSKWELIADVILA